MLEDPNPTPPGTPIAQPPATAPDPKAGAGQPGTGTQPATPEAQPNITETPEFKAAVTAAIEKKIPQLKRQIARSISGDKEPGSEGEELQQRLSDAETRLRTFESKAAVRDFLTDSKNKLNIPTDTLSGIEELVTLRLEYGEDGKPSNLKEAVESVKSSFPRLFAAPQSSINANNGNGQKVTAQGMDSFIRQGAGHGN